MYDRGQTFQRQIGFLHLPVLESHNANIISHLTTLPLMLLCTKSQQEKKIKQLKSTIPPIHHYPPPETMSSAAPPHQKARSFKHSPPFTVLSKAWKRHGKQQRCLLIFERSVSGLYSIITNTLFSGWWNNLRNDHYVCWIAHQCCLSWHAWSKCKHQLYLV